jgi:hypothetical protein
VYSLTSVHICFSSIVSHRLFFLFWQVSRATKKRKLLVPRPVVEEEVQSLPETELDMSSSKFKELFATPSGTLTATLKSTTQHLERQLQLYEPLNVNTLWPGTPMASSGDLLVVIGDGLPADSQPRFNDLEPLPPSVMRLVEQRGPLVENMVLMGADGVSLETHPHLLPFDSVNASKGKPLMLAVRGYEHSIHVPYSRNQLFAVTLRYWATLLATVAPFPPGETEEYDKVLWYVVANPRWLVNLIQEKRVVCGGGSTGHALHLQKPYCYALQGLKFAQHALGLQCTMATDMPPIVVTRQYDYHHDGIWAAAVMEAVGQPRRGSALPLGPKGQLELTRAVLAFWCGSTLVYDPSNHQQSVYKLTHLSGMSTLFRNICVA